MSCDFKPGDEVVCVDATGVPALEAGRTYVIEGVIPPGTYILSTDGRTGVTSKPAVQLVDGRVYAGHRVGYRPSRFRKVQRRNLTEWLSTAVDVPALDKGAPKRRVKA